MKMGSSLAMAAVRASLLNQWPEGYVKGCTALGGRKGLKFDYSQLEMATLIISGAEDELSPPVLFGKMV